MAQKCDLPLKLPSAGGLKWTQIFLRFPAPTVKGNLGLITSIADSLLRTLVTTMSVFPGFSKFTERVLLCFRRTLPNWSGFGSHVSRNAAFAYGACSTLSAASASPSANISHQKLATSKTDNLGGEANCMSRSLETFTGKPQV